MKVITWNIQAAKGVDGVVNVRRIADITQAMGDADVICYQEVMNHTVDGVSHNQAQALAQHFPEFQSFYGAAIDRAHETSRLQFGNLLLTRLPALQSSQHRLPQPADPGSLCMPRQATEVLVKCEASIYRIVTAHLDYFATIQRTAQVRYLRGWHEQTLARYNEPGAVGGELQFQSLPETALSLYCGDFNMGVDSADYAILTSGDHEPAESQLFDCWTLANPGQPHAPTCGIYDRDQWPEGAHCRDFFFASNAMAMRIDALTVNTETDASDHQPLMLTIS